MVVHYPPFPFFIAAASHFNHSLYIPIHQINHYKATKYTKVTNHSYIILSVSDKFRLKCHYQVDLYEITV